MTSPPSNTRSWTHRFWSVLVSVIFLITAGDEVLNLGYWKHQRTLNFDIETYYHYLPATFIHGEPLDLGYVAALDSITLHPGQGQMAHGVHLVQVTGHHVLKVTCGVAICELPLFLCAHAYCLLFDPAIADGYSAPYQLMVSFSAVASTFFGLLVLGLFLRRYVTDQACAWALLILGSGTNLFFYSTVDSGMPHSFSFLLFSLTLERTDAWYRSPSAFKAATLGLAIGLATLIRPVDLILVIIPLLWPIPDHQRSRWAMLSRFHGHVLLAILCAATLLLPQTIYWKAATGQWLYWSYESEGFHWADPHIIEGLFGYRKGWIIYSPLVLLGFAGLGLMFARPPWRKFAWPIALFFLPAIYITFSWSSWWYGGGFGCRPLVGSLALLALPLAILAQRLTKHRRLTGPAFAILVLAGITLNRFQQDQFTQTILHWDSMTCQRYWEIWGRSTWEDLTPFP